MGKLVCRIELNKETGITITVDNAEGKITQTITMDGTSIVTKCKGDSETSTITQKQDSITIACKEFKIEAETIACHSTKATTHKSDDKFDITSTNDMTLQSRAKLTESATSDVSISGSKIAGSAQNEVSLSGMSVAISGTNEVKASGLQLKLSGTTKAEMAAPMIEIKADATMTVKGALTSVEGQITNIKGSLVKLGS